MQEGVQNSLMDEAGFNFRLLINSEIKLSIATVVELFEGVQLLSGFSRTETEQLSTRACMPCFR